MSVPKIYPICLSEEFAEALVRQHAGSEFDEKTRWHTRYASYDFCADVLENGDVKLIVRYSDDNGFCSSGGCLLTKVIRPFDDAKLAALKDKQMMALAADEYFRRKNAEEVAAILAIKAELFGSEQV